MALDKFSPRLWVGLILIVLGGLFLLNNYDILDFSIPHYIFKWQSILILIGLFIFLTGKNKTTGILLITIGLIGFIPEIWPLLLIGFGIYIILRKSGHSTGLGFKSNEDKEKISQDILDDVSIFGGGTKIIQSNKFRGGKVTAIFGGSEIDLLDCKLADGNNIIDVFAMFGGSSFIVPKDWKIVLDIVPIFGGFSDQRRKDPNLVFDENRVLIIKGIVLFGGGEIKN